MGRPKKIKQPEQFNVDETIKKVKKHTNNNYNVVLETSGNTYKGAGATADEAIASLGLDWNQIKGKGVMTLTKGKEKVEQLFYLKQLKRIFASKITRLLWGKRLEKLMK